MQIYPYWNQTEVADDYGNLIPAPSFEVKIQAINTFFCPEIF